jgi:hypothetical protein
MAQNSLTNYFICSKKWILSGIGIHYFKWKLAEGTKKIKKGGNGDENREVLSNSLFGIHIRYYRLESAHTGTN